MSIKLSFLGAAQNVTGSRHLLEADGARVLVDCGLYQERKFLARNWEAFPVSPKKLDAVLLTHAHLDHCGLLPKLVREGFAGPIYCTAATAEIARIVLLDSAHIQEEDAEHKRRRHRKEGRKGPYPVVPLYTVAEAEAALPQFSPVRYEQTVKIASDVEATFCEAGHILGSSMISVQVGNGRKERTILFSGDVGRKNMPIIQDPSRVKHADYVLVESTYGDRVHPDAEDVENELARVINAAVEAGGNVVIPSFAVERSQDLLYHINELKLAKRIPDLRVFLDSPMAISVTDVFEDHPELFDEEMSRRVGRNRSPFELRKLKMTRTSKESKAINRLRGTSVIIAGSGMCTGGRIKHHLVNNITRPESTILFVGYQAAGTLGRIILDGVEEVRILGQMHPVKARIEQIGGFSAHADRDELLNWLSGLREAPREVFVVHGEAESAERFGRYLRDKKGWNVTVPEYGDKVTLK